MTATHDAIVIGGGPAGASTALLLARAGWSVVVLERKAFPRRKVCGEYLSATNLPLLDRLGIGAAFRALAGPSVERVGLFAGATRISAPLPRGPGSGSEWGRALGREHLDTLLLAEARRAGADVRQPCAVTAICRDGPRYRCEARGPRTAPPATFTAPIVVAAHGSWDAGSLPTQPPRAALAPADLLGFKAHFTRTQLPSGLMPLLAFAGGYGGMVHCDGGRVSLSCCVRRDRLDQMRTRYGGEAGDAIEAHLRASCAGVAEALAGADRTEPWLGAGPIRPGIHLYRRGGIFPVGNAAGEAHPVIAEGISIALQSGWLLARYLIPWRRAGGATEQLAHVASAYGSAWRRHFAGRLRASEAIARWAMSPFTVAIAIPLLRFFPVLLNYGARLSGKADTRGK